MKKNKRPVERSDRSRFALTGSFPYRAWCALGIAGPPGGGTAGVAARGGRSSGLRRADDRLAILCRVHALGVHLHALALVGGDARIAVRLLAPRDGVDLDLMDLLAPREPIRQHHECLAVVDGDHPAILGAGEASVVPAALLGATGLRGFLLLLTAPHDEGGQSEYDREYDRAHRHDWPPGLVYDDLERIGGSTQHGDLCWTVRSVRPIESLRHQILDLPERGGPGAWLEQDVLPRSDAPHRHETRRLVDDEDFPGLHLVAGHLRRARLFNAGTGIGPGLHPPERHGSAQDARLRRRVVAAVVSPIVVAGSLPRTMLVPAVALAASDFDTHTNAGATDTNAGTDADVGAVVPRVRLLCPNGGTEDRDHDGREQLQGPHWRPPGLCHPL